MLQVFTAVHREHGAAAHDSLSVEVQPGRLQCREAPEMPVGCSVWVCLTSTGAKSVMWKPSMGVLVKLLLLWCPQCLYITDIAVPSVTAPGH